MSDLVARLPGNQVTPVDLNALRMFYIGLCAIAPTLMCGAPGAVGLVISGGLYELLKDRFCSDPQFARVMANVWVQDVKTIKQGGDIR